MFFCKKLAAAVMVFLMALPVPVPAKTRKGEKFLNQAKTAELSKKYDEALDLIEQAMSEDPTDPAYQMVMRRVRFQAAQHHVDVGEKLRAGGKLEEALAEFERAYAIDPASSIAEQEIRQTRGMIERNRKKEVAPEDSGLTPAQRAKKATLEKIERAMPVPELKPLSSRPIDLKMNNQPPKVLFETLGKLAGVNVIF